MAAHINCYWELHIKHCGIYLYYSLYLFPSLSFLLTPLSHSTLSLSFSLSFRLSHCLSAFVFGNCVKYQSRFASHVKLMKLQRDLRHGTTVKGGREGETEVYWRRGGKGNGDDTSLARWCHKAMRTQQVIHKCN